MFIKVYKEEIIDGLQKSANLIPQRTGAAYLRSIWIRAENEKIEIMSTDSNIEFRGSYAAQVIESGLIGVPGRQFVELLRKLPAGQLSLKVEAGKGDAASSVLHIEQGRRKYRMAVNDSTWFQNFADFPEDGAVIWAGDFLQELIDRIAYCIGDDGSDALSCFFMKPGVLGRIEAAGMTGHQFAMRSFTNGDLSSLLPDEGILIQKKYLLEMKKWLADDEIEINIGDKRLFVRRADHSESLSLPLAFHQYPDYTIFVAGLKSDDVSKLNIAREDAVNSLERIAVFNTDNNACAYFDLSEKEAVITAQGHDVGSASESLDVEYSGGLAKIAFPTNNLLGIMDHFKSQELTLTMTGPQGPCGVSGKDDSDYLVIVMPMAILEEKSSSEEEI
ncbi:MAG: DNA polymerase III subunit beta [Desulfovibrio sp.]|jgi:DNA polymerase-3 subunit beta|nr:DNA polymerase III subunit beta [Desulfovibrio sp.]